MNDVLYEASFEFDLVFLIPIFMLIYISIFPKIVQKFYENKDIKINYNFVKIFCGCAFAFVAVLSIIVGISQVNMFNKTVGAYN